jgi:uncharacterized coiled-coil protein SlyX
MAKPVKKKAVSRSQSKKPLKKASPSKVSGSKTAKSAKPKAPASRPVWATKDDLALLAPKSALGKFASKTDLEGLVTREELAGLAARRELLDLEQRLVDLDKKISTVDGKIEVLASQAGDHPEAFNQIHAEIAKLRESLSMLETRLLEKPSVEHENRIKNLEGI